MTETYNSIIEVEKKFFPYLYQKRLAEQGRYEELAKYLKENNLELSPEIRKNPKYNLPMFFPHSLIEIIEEEVKRIFN